MKRLIREWVISFLIAIVALLGVCIADLYIKHKDNVFKIQLLESEFNDFVMDLN